jgi:hypothetical protein
MKGTDVPDLIEVREYRNAKAFEIDAQKRLDAGWTQEVPSWPFSRLSRCCPRNSHETTQLGR